LITHAANTSSRAPGHDEAVIAANARLERIVRDNFATIWRLARRWGLSSADADDLAQGAVVVASRRLAEIEPGRERAFLCRTALHLAANARRSQRARPEDHVESWEDHDSALPDPEQLLQQRRARAELDAILDELPEPLRAVFVLFELELLTQIEIADALQIPQGTVASRLRKARELVAASIERSVHRSSKMGGRR
jgi:RNA polymerase sigma-70 factor (ECF subfamily)